MGYTIYRRDRNSQWYGKVCIYVRDELISCEVNNCELNDQKVEQVWCERKVWDERILIGYIDSPILF